MEKLRLDKMSVGIICFAAAALFVGQSSGVATDHHVSFTFVLINGSLVPVIVDPNGGSSAPGTGGQGETAATTSGISGSMVAAMFIAIVVFNMAFVGSLLLIVTIGNSLTLKR